MSGERSRVRQARFGAAIGALAPGVGDGARDRLVARAGPQRLPQIDAARRVEAQIPQPVGRQPAAIAGRGRTAPSSTR